MFFYFELIQFTTYSVVTLLLLTTIARLCDIMNKIVVSKYCMSLSLTRIHLIIV